MQQINNYLLDFFCVPSSKFSLNLAQGQRPNTIFLNISSPTWGVGASIQIFAHHPACWRRTFLFPLGCHKFKHNPGNFHQWTPTQLSVPGRISLTKPLEWSLVNFFDITVLRLESDCPLFAYELVNPLLMTEGGRNDAVKFS